MKLSWNVTPTEAQALLPIGDKTITFSANNFRTERSSKKATVGIFIDSILLEEDDITIGKRDDRQRLMNSAHKQLTDSISINYKTDFPVASAQRLFMNYLKEVWAQWHDTRGVTDTIGTVPTEVPWLLAPFITINAGTILFAPPSSGKSWLGLSLAVAVNVGGSSLWTPRKQTNALYINLERSPESFERRLGSVNAALLGHAERQRPLKMLHARGKSLTDVGETVERAVNKYDIGLVILDSLSRAGSSLIDDTAANRTMDSLNRFGCAWLAIGHTPRDNVNHVFGSQMFSAAADQEWSVSHVQHDEMMWQKMNMIKGNDVPNMADVHIQYQMDKYGIQSVKHIEKEQFPTVVEEY